MKTNARTPRKTRRRGGENQPVPAPVPVSPVPNVATANMGSATANTGSATANTGSPQASNVSNKPWWKFWGGKSRRKRSKRRTRK